MDGGEPDPVLAAVVVSYNVAPLLARCLESLRRAGEELQSRATRPARDRRGQRLRGRQRGPRPGALPRGGLLVESRVNLGFGAGCNLGAGAAPGSPLLLFLNPDAEVTPGAVPALLERLRHPPAAAIAGPRLTSPDGAPQEARRRFPTLGALLLESTPLEWRHPGWSALRRYRFEGRSEAPGPVDWLSGACLLVRRTAFDEVGGFDPLFFMYFEEADLARRLAGRGWETWYEPAAVVLHHRSRSADQDVGARDRHYYGSKYRYAGRYWGRTVARALRLSGGALFGAEWAIQTARRDPALARRYRALTRWHFAP